MQAARGGLLCWAVGAVPVLRSSSQELVTQILFPTLQPAPTTSSPSQDEKQRPDSLAESPAAHLACPGMCWPWRV